jgi:hypothetical protein
MNPQHCRVLLERKLGKQQQEHFQHSLRRVLTGLFTYKDEVERAGWIDCLSCVSRGSNENKNNGIRLNLSYDNYINLCLLAACSSSLHNHKNLIPDLISSYDVHTKCINKYITQSQSINEDGDEWKWTAICALIPMVKLNYTAQQYLIQQSTHRLTKLMYLCDINSSIATADSNYRLKVNQAVFCIAKLYEQDPTLHSSISGVSFSVLLKLLESLDTELDSDDYMATTAAMNGTYSYDIY